MEMRVMGTDLRVPFALMSESWAQRIHSQTLSTLNGRGGMSPAEVYANLHRIYVRDVKIPELALVEIIRAAIQVHELTQDHKCSREELEQALKVSNRDVLEQTLLLRGINDKLDTLIKVFERR